MGELRKCSVWQPRLVSRGRRRELLPPPCLWTLVVGRLANGRQDRAGKRFARDRCVRGSCPLATTVIAALECPRKPRGDCSGYLGSPRTVSAPAASETSTRGRVLKLHVGVAVHHLDHASETSTRGRVLKPRT